jgi:hypothetical protein
MLLYSPLLGETSLSNYVLNVYSLACVTTLQYAVILYFPLNLLSAHLKKTTAITCGVHGSLINGQHAGLLSDLLGFQIPAKGRNMCRDFCPTCAL